MRRIESPHNERLREVARLIASSRDRRKSGRCVLEGVHLVDVYVGRVGAPETLVVLDDARERSDVQALLQRVPESRTFIVTRARFAELATLPADVGVLAVVATPKFAISPSAEFCLLIDDIQDPGNVGSIIRTAAAAGVEQVLLSSHSAFAWAPKVLRAAQGAHFLTNVVEDVDLVGWVQSFRAAGGRVFATVVDGASSLYDANLCGRIAFVTGREGQGVSQPLREKVDAAVTIPMATGNESLNAAAATAVVLFEAVRQRRTTQDLGSEI
ncbi:MAG TPA: RNA methyltransferase [Casimicrobiaceae bacterium]|nr:RNA methyltransferase [Casimicrobiaceae bacterium]